MTKHKTEMEVIHSWDEVPRFASEAEESAWWGSHDLSEEMLAAFKPVPPEGDDWLPPARPDTYPVGLRLTAVEIKRLKALAAKRHTRHQRLVAKWVLERLAQEEASADGAGETRQASSA